MTANLTTEEIAALVDAANKQLEAQPEGPPYGITDNLADQHVSLSSGSM